MAIPVLKLNLVPEPSLWRQNHEALGWGALGLGALLLAGTSAYAGWKYVSASREAKRKVQITAEARKVAREQETLVARLKAVDVSAEMPRWRLAERILSERSLPWSRLTAELERSLVQDVRVKSIQRTRGSDQGVQLALKGEARSRDAEVKFIERLQGNGVFAQVLLEREAERQGGGLDFEVKLPASSTPRPYEPLPEPEYARGAAPAPVAPPAPAARPVPAKGAAPPPAKAVTPTAGVDPAAIQKRLGPPPDLSTLSPAERNEAIRRRIEAVRAAETQALDAARREREAEAGKGRAGQASSERRRGGRGGDQP
ncbi:MAG: hypothetical protein U0P81_14125 [Holophagaceae bacterium]